MKGHIYTFEGNGSGINKAFKQIIRIFCRLQMDSKFTERGKSSEKCYSNAPSHQLNPARTLRKVGIVIGRYFNYSSFEVQECSTTAEITSVDSEIIPRLDHWMMVKCRRGLMWLGAEAGTTLYSPTRLRLPRSPHL